MGQVYVQQWTSMQDDDDDLSENLRLPTHMTITTIVSVSQAQNSSTLTKILRGSLSSTKSKTENLSTITSLEVVVSRADSGEVRR